MLEEWTLFLEEQSEAAKEQLLDENMQYDRQINDIAIAPQLKSVEVSVPTSASVQQLHIPQTYIDDVPQQCPQQSSILQHKSDELDHQVPSSVLHGSDTAEKSNGSNDVFSSHLNDNQSELMVPDDEDLGQPRNETHAEDRADEEDEDEDWCDDLALFRGVMEDLNLQKLGQVALMVRLCVDFSPQLDMKSLPTLSAKVSDDPMNGAYNLVYIIRFSDGVRWIARVPGHGRRSRFSKVDAMKMDSEYLTQRYIRRYTSIPVPEIFFWDSTCGRIGVPFALMPFVEGDSLAEVWNEQYSEQQRLDVLSSIASYLSELRELSFNQLGMLRFDDEEEVAGIGKYMCLQSRGAVPWFKTVTNEPHLTLMESFWDVFNEEAKEEEDGEAEEEGKYAYIEDEEVDEGEEEREEEEEQQEEEDEDDRRDHLAISILRLLVESIPTFLASETRYAITPVDLNYQNIIIGTDGKITAFIDWDQVHTEATCSGYGRYPAFLTRDWQPSYYHGESTPPDDEDWPESSPEQLSIYRQHYLAEFSRHSQKYPDYDPRHTKLSHIMEALIAGLGSRSSRPYVVDRLLKHASLSFTLEDYINDAAKGDTKVKDEMMKRAFTTDLWHAEWERPSKRIEEDSESESDDLSTSTAATNTDNGSDRSTRLTVDGVDECSWSSVH